MTAIQGPHKTALALALALTGTFANAEGTYRFTELGTFGGSWSEGSALNRVGVVAGSAGLPLNGEDPPEEPPHPARWTSPAGTDLGTLGGVYGYARGINNAGVIAGYTWLPNGAGVHATLWNGATITDLGTLGGAYSHAYAINKAGVVAGSASTAGNAAERAVVWKNGVPRILPGLGGRYHRAVAITDNGLAAGMSSDASGDQHAVIWRGGALTDLGAGNYVFGINASGHAVGYMSSGGYAQATLWVAAVPQSLPCLGGPQCMANGINDDGIVVGESRIDDGNDNHAAMWVGGTAIDLNDKLDQATRDAGWVLMTAQAINSRGFVTGQARNAFTGQRRAYLLSR